MKLKVYFFDSTDVDLGMIASNAGVSNAVNVAATPKPATAVAKDLTDPLDLQNWVEKCALVFPVYILYNIALQICTWIMICTEYILVRIGTSQTYTLFVLQDGQFKD